MSVSHKGSYVPLSPLGHDAGIIWTNDADRIPTKFPKVRILLLENIHIKASMMLEDEGFYVETHAGSLTEDELVEKMESFHVIGIRSKTHITKRVLDAAPRLLAVGCFCIGTNQVDLSYAQKKGVVVFNSPYQNSRSVAELVMAEIICLARQLGDRNSEMHKGQWQKTAKGCHEVRGKTLGIVGYGHVGSQLSVLAEMFGLRVIFYDIQPQMPLGNASAFDSLEGLLRESDIVSLHVPLTEDTKGMIKKEHFDLMRDDTYFINASRGVVVDLEALKEAINSGKLAGAAVDVFAVEPKKNGDFVTPLAGCRNTILTPHIGGATEEAQAAIGVEVASAISKLIRYGSTGGAVNFPILDVQPKKASHGEGETHRVTVVHRNTPGVLRKIMNIIADGVNVEQQLLSTDADTGYLILDLDQEASVEFARNVDGFEETITTRVLF